MTPTTVGWVMAESRVDDCPTFSGDELGITRGAGLDAVGMAASASAVATRVRTVLAAGGDRLHGVSVTWSDDAAAGAALLLESLTAAGFDNVTPVRFSQATASLVGDISPDGERTAVCVIEPGSATLVVFDGSDDEDPIVSTCPVGGTNEVLGWLAEAFGSGGLRPDVLIVAGSMRGMDRLARRLEATFSLPVFVQTRAQQALARGAALALAPHTDLAGAVPVPVAPDIDSGRPMSLSYVGALTMLTGGAVMFVASLSAALSLQLGPGKDLEEVRAPEHVTVARVAVPAAPAPPPVAPAPVDELPEASGEFGLLWDTPTAVPAPSASAGPSLRDRVRKHIPRLPGR